MGGQGWQGALRLTPTVKCTVGIASGCFWPSADGPHVCPKELSPRQSAKEPPALAHHPAFLWWSCSTEASKIPGPGVLYLSSIACFCVFCSSIAQHNTTHLHIPRISPDRERRDAQSPVVAWLPRVKGCAACRVLSGQRPADTASLTSSTRCRVTILFSPRA